VDEAEARLADMGQVLLRLATAAGKRFAWSEDDATDEERQTLEDAPPAGAGGASGAASALAIGNVMCRAESCLFKPMTESKTPRLPDFRQAFDSARALDDASFGRRRRLRRTSPACRSRGRGRG
jgi:hypothetical protein